MVINFLLSADKYLRHNEIITLPEDTVELGFDRGIYAAGELILTIAKGSECKQYKIPRENIIDITEFFHEAGEVKACLSLTVRGEVAREWQIEPFCAREIPNGIEVIPEVEALKEEIATLKVALVELHTIINEQEI